MPNTPKRANRKAQQQQAAAAAVGSDKAAARPSSERSPAQGQPAEKARRVQAPSASKSLFDAPRTTPAASAAKAAATAERSNNDDEILSRVFSTPDGRTVTIPARFAPSEDASFSYKAGHLEGGSGKDFAKVFDPSLYVREAFFQGFSDAVAIMKAEKNAKVDTPELREGRSGPVQKAEIHTYVEKAKAGKLSALIKQHVNCDYVCIQVGDKVFEMARPYFFRQGDEGELKAFTSYFLKSVLGDAYDMGDFIDAWESGCEVEKVTKARKADLTGIDKSRIKTTVTTVTLKAEIKIMYNNARAYLVAKVWAVYREVNNVPPRPKGEQNTAGQRAAKIEDPAWEVHAKQMQVAAAKATSRYGAPHMEGPFNENPDEDCSLDPVGQVSAVRALAIIFRGQKIDEMKLREQISEGNLPEFRMVEIAIFSTVVQDKIKLVRRGATCSEGTFDNQLKDTMRFLVKKFERFGWTNKEGKGSTPALTKLIKISDYPVSARPLLTEDDDAYFVDNDGIKVEKAVPLAGEEERKEEEEVPEEEEEAKEED